MRVTKKKLKEIKWLAEECRKVFAPNNWETGNYFGYDLANLTLELVNSLEKKKELRRYKNGKVD